MTNNKKPSRQEMIDSIYEKIARKDLTFGCRMKISEYGEEYDEICIEESSEHFFIGAYFHSCRKNKIKKIIGHPVMIGDVMDYFDFKIYNHGSYGYEMNRNLHDISWFWHEKRKPIEEQSEECIAFVYNLISE